jgi:hypothetical protein
MMSELPGPTIDTGTDPMVRRTILPTWLKLLTAFAAVLAAASMFLSATLFATNRAGGRANCMRIHRVVETLDQILISSRTSAHKYEIEGTITKAQLRRTLDEDDKARSKLYRADCPPGSAPHIR